MVIICTFVLIVLVLAGPSDSGRTDGSATDVTVVDDEPTTTRTGGSGVRPESDPNGSASTLDAESGTVAEPVTAHDDLEDGVGSSDDHGAGNDSKGDGAQTAPGGGGSADDTDPAEKGQSGTEDDQGIGDAGGTDDAGTDGNQPIDGGDGPGPSPAPFSCEATPLSGQVRISWEAREGEERAFRSVDDAEGQLTGLIFVAEDGTENIIDTTLPSSGSLRYRIVSADSASATCDFLVPPGIGESPERAGPVAHVGHPCDGPAGGIGPLIEPNPDELRVIDGASIGVPGADFVCGGVNPVIREALVDLAIDVIDLGPGVVTVIVPGGSIVDGVPADAALPEAVDVRIVPKITVLDVGAAVVELIEANPAEAAVVLDGATVTGLLVLDPAIGDALELLPPAVFAGDRIVPVPFEAAPVTGG
jgi:hypothetical protein